MESGSLVGTRLGKYELRAEIGRGGMGTVFRGFDPTLNRPVAIKVLAPHLVWEREFVERFLREAQAAAGLDHPNIVAVYDVGQESGWFYFVMKYLEGQALTEVLRRMGPMPLEDALQVLRPLAQALDYAHSKGIVHRDVKPGNVVVGPEGHVTLTDFGIARAVQATRLTRSGVVIGTPEYMSPEQALGSPVDMCSDQYGLAVMAHEMLAGRVPFQADNTPALMYQLVHQAPPPLGRVRPDLPGEVGQALERALAKDPRQRYRNCQEFVDALGAATALGDPVVSREAVPAAPRSVAPSSQPPAIAYPEAVSSRVTRPDARQLTHEKKAMGAIPTWVWGLAGLAIIALAIGLGVALGGARETPTPRPGTAAPVEAPTEAVEATAEEERAAPAEEQEAVPLDEEAITLRMMCWLGSIRTVGIVDDELIPGFTAMYPNVTIEYEELPWGDYWTKIAALAAANDMPDIYCNSVAYLWDHANKGMALNIQPYFDRDLTADDYFMELTTISRYPDGSGDLYSFPFRWVDGALFYNKALFDEAGLDYPSDDWTYDDVLTAAKELTKDTDGDGEIDQWGVQANNVWIFLDSVIKSNGGTVVDDTYSKCTLTEPEALEAIQWMVDLVQEFGVSPSPEQASGFAEGVFPAGKLAMTVDGSYMTVPYSEITDFEWDVSMQPVGTESRVVYGGPDSFAIGKNSENPDAAWDFLKYILSPEVQSRGDIIGLGSLPMLQSAAYADAWTNAEGQPSNAAVFADSGPYVVGADFGSQWIEWRATIMVQELDQALLGQRSVEESAEAACTAINQVLEAIDKP